MGSEALSRIASPDLERDLESFHPSSFGWGHGLLPLEP